MAGDGEVVGDEGALDGEQKVVGHPRVKVRVRDRSWGEGEGEG